MRNFHLVSLGCAKNLVDSEVMISSLIDNGWGVVDDPYGADLLIVNTCGFIQPAVEEAIEEIIGMGEVKERNPDTRLVAIGCFVQRYKSTLSDELPEVDLFIGTEACHRIGDLVEDLFDQECSEADAKLILPPRFLMEKSHRKILATPSHRAWFKMTEGCDNRCSYCMIPSIRGDLRSRTIDDLVCEARWLEGQGVRELSCIAQDLTAYGDDLDEDVNLVSLLKNVLGETRIPWIRLLYLYPTGVTDSLLELMAENPRILPYLDIPFQHVSDSVLRRMNRRHGGDELYRLVERVRSYLPEVALRTTFLVGFPGETENDVEKLMSFMKEVRLDHVGVFPYANEEGCPSEHFDNQIPDDEKNRRRDELLEIQSGISRDIQKKYIGRKEPVLVDGLSRETDLLLEGRTRFQAPEVDGCVYINDGQANSGDIVMVEVTESQVYDLVGRVVEREE